MGYRLDRRRVITSLLVTAVFNTVIALFLTLIGFGRGFLVNFTFSQSIGLCMCSTIMAAHAFMTRPSAHGHAILLLVTIPTGAMAGSLIGAGIAGVPLSGFLQGRPAPFFQALFIGILFGTIATYFFFSRERISQTEALLQEEQIKRLTQEKKTLEIHLRLLQAQIEPHFLFNSLSNILGLLESDPIKGRGMLVDLTRYLRASLSRTRDTITTIGQEMELIRAYLDIYRIRMGERLRYTLDLPEGLRGEPFPPMLLQPLVENAVKHGLEPKIEGGEISIRVEDETERLRLTVADTGAGFSGSAGPGVGLENVRARLAALYNGKGKLILEENRPSGLKVTLEVPRGGSEGDHCR